MSEPINEGIVIGQAIVVEGDDLDVFGNHKAGSQPMVMESYLNNSPQEIKDQAVSMASKNPNRLGRVLVCKLVVMYEVAPDSQ
jgi:hypothetical protein